jgi:hypothetical protein
MSNGNAKRLVARLKLWLIRSTYFWWGKAHQPAAYTDLVIKKVDNPTKTQALKD